jgi:iron-sulfur cluster repair protein YtfE (RIC family)
VVVENLDPLSMLKDEHSSILQHLYRLDRILLLLESSRPAQSKKFLRLLLEESRKMWFELSRHTSKEDKILFPLLEKRMGSDAGPVHVMEREHLELLSSVVALRSEIQRSIEDHYAPKTWSLSGILQDLRVGLSDHISREERVLFWLAELHLSDVDRRKASFDLAQMTDVLPDESFRAEAPLIIPRIK